MCSGVLSSALWHLHNHGISLHCVHGHGALHWTLDTAAVLELDAGTLDAAAAALDGTLGAASALAWGSTIAEGSIHPRRLPMGAVELLVVGWAEATGCSQLCVSLCNVIV